MAIALVNSISAIAASAAAVTTAALSITAGNLIVVGTSNFAAGGANNNLSVTDSAGNTYTAIGSSLLADGSRYATLWYAKNVTGGSVTFTFTLVGSPADFPRIYVAQFSGADTTAPLDAGSSASFAATSSGATAFTSPQLSTVAASTLLAAIAIDSGSSLTTTFADGGGTNNSGTWTPIVTTSDTSTLEGGLAYALETAAGGYKVTATTSGSTLSHSVGIASFKAAAGGAATVDFRRSLGEFGTGAGRRQHLGVA